MSSLAGGWTTQEKENFLKIIMGKLHLFENKLLNIMNKKASALMNVM